MSDAPANLVDTSTPEGSNIFDDQGNAYQMLAWTAHGIVAAQLFTDDDYGVRASEYPVVLSQAFTSPWVPKRHEIAIDLEKRAEDARQTLNDLTSKIRGAETSLAAALAKTTAIPALSRIQDFIDGKVTHFVREQYDGLEIIPQSRSGKPDHYGRVPQEFKLLTLYGSSQGDLSWKIHDYNDGSGCGRYTCIPCTSYEEALAEATKIAARVFDENRASGFSRLHVELVRSCVRLGIPVPADVIEKLERVHDNDGAYADEQIAKIKDDYAKKAKATADLVAACKAMASKSGGGT